MTRQLTPHRNFLHFYRWGKISFVNLYFYQFNHWSTNCYLLILYLDLYIVIFYQYLKSNCINLYSFVGMLGYQLLSTCCSLYPDDESSGISCMWYLDQSWILVTATIINHQLSMSPLVNKEGSHDGVVSLRTKVNTCQFSSGQINRK